MSSGTKTPLDQPVRDRLVKAFERNLLVEAGAGSGKTYSLAMRMAAGIAAGTYRVEQMAAVTFTRKAAAELRGRFRLALETHLGEATRAAERERLEAALAGIERLFAGTIHAFCAHLLRERPIDAEMAPDFVELDDEENGRRRQQAWRDYVVAARASGVPPMLDLLEAGIKPKDLDGAFAAICDHEDVAFDHGDGDPPDVDATLKHVEQFWKALGQLKPDAFRPETTCQVQQRFDEFEGRLAFVKRHHRLAALGSLLTFWRSAEVTQKWWSGEVGRESSYGKRVKELVDDFREHVVDPFLAEWRAYVHHLAMQVLDAGRQAFANERRRENLVNYVDLLRRTAAMLRERGDVRRSLQQKYRWLFIDEFQDTDPIQAEIFLMLAADEGDAGEGAAGGAAAGTPRARATRGARGEQACDPFALPLRPGALFVVGDPKQSIFRFRRADIDIYTRVRQRIVETGGEVLSLTANFRSRREVCALANTVFPPLFARFTAPYSPAFEPLDPVRARASQEAGPGVAKLTIPAVGKKPQLVAPQAGRIAAYIHAEVTAGRRRYGDFLVIARQRPRLGVYAEAFDALEIPVEVSGAGLFCASPAVRALALLLDALADPLDAVSLVGVLRGPLFGLSDPELFQFRQAGGRFELSVPLPEAASAQEAAGLDEQFGPTLEAMRRVQDLWRRTRRMPLAAAVDRILDDTGWLALASTTPGGARAGHLVQAVDRVRDVAERGGGLADAADALNEEHASNEAEALPLRPGRRDVVRLMNLHKAKGLEAPVVVLADAAHAYEFPVHVRVVREGDLARGYLRIVKSSENSWATQVLGEPIDWNVHQQEEERYRDAEHLRLLYVAGTRAKDLLVVCRIDAPNMNKAWSAFEGYLRAMPELIVPASPRAAKPMKPDLSAGTRAAADADRQAKHDRARRPSWAVLAPSEARSRRAAAERAKRAAGDAEAANAVPDTPSHRADAGVAWGSLVHGLLEHAMRHPSASRDDLARLALWLTVETPDLRPFVSEALDLVEAASKAPFWREARAGREVCVEVPFAVRIAAGQSAPGVEPVTVPTVLHGVIDLAYRAGEGWRILDYKTDRLDGMADVDAELLARHGTQLRQYRFAWDRVAEGGVASAALVALREMRVVIAP